MPYVFSGKLEVPKGQNPNFNFPFDGHVKTDESAEYASMVLAEMERRHCAVIEAILKDGDREVKRYSRMEKESEVLVC